MNCSVTASSKTTHLYYRKYALAHKSSAPFAKISSLIHFSCFFSVLGITGSVTGETNYPLLEDLLLREFLPILPALQAMQYGAEETLSTIQEVLYSVAGCTVAVEPAWTFHSGDSVMSY